MGAFTLVELRVAIAIIASRRAKGTADASNLCQLGPGLAVYADDHHGHFPETALVLPEPLHGSLLDTASPLRPQKFYSLQLPLR